MNVPGLAARAEFGPGLAGVEARLTRLVARLSPDCDRPIAVAVSGGSDSMALLQVLTSWASRAGRRLHVLTVDHGLRPEAVAETRFVAERSQALGQTCTCLRWTDQRAGQAAARAARHRLLADAARRVGAELLCLGHTLDDVIETLLMRRRRGVRSAHQAGPAMISASPVWPEGRDLALCRPLILSRRQTLRDALQQAGEGWIEDPSNQNPVYERARLRQHLARHPAWTECLGAAARQALTRRHAADADLAAAVLDPNQVEILSDGLIRFTPTDRESPLALAALGLLVRLASGGDRTPRAGALRDVVRGLRDPGDRATLGGAWLQTSRSGLLIGRDPGQGRGTVTAGLWDGRYAPAPDAPALSGVSPLLRDTGPPGPGWRPIMAARLSYEAGLMGLNAALA